MSPEPELSIVIAASHSQQTIDECLGALRPQLAGHAAEVFVAATTEADARVVRERYPDMTLLTAPGSTLTPGLWGLGASRARGRVIAFTVATCIPDAHWVEEILRAHSDYHTAIGGAIENVPDAGLVDWAVYFVRYTPHMLPFQPGPGEVPGDNGSYKRAGIADQMKWIEANGFWEQAVNANLRSQMRSLWREPRIVVYSKKPFTVLGFSRQRLVHGRVFGKMRAAGCTRRQRVAYILTSPAIPLVYLARISRNLARKKRHRAAYALSLPLIVWFLCCWAMGEFVGLLRG